ncbi:MAG: hypothetical protein HY555_05070, partial [Euryarchaeota archaeon]|nr:hypothetical protein [Euryarchaeota archaeon]
MEKIRGAPLYALIGILFIVLGAAISGFVAHRNGGESQVYSAKELQSTNLESLQGYHTQVNMDSKGRVIPDELNAEYDMANLPDVWLAYMEAVNNGRMDYAVDRLLSSRFKEKYGENLAEMRRFNTTHKILNYKIVNTTFDGDRANLAYAVEYRDLLGFKHRAQGYQDFVKEAG